MGQFLKISDLCSVKLITQLIMDLTITKFEKGNEVMNLTCELTSIKEVITSVKTIMDYISNKVAEVFASEQPYEVINEEGATGFVSDNFQYMSGKNYICLTEGNTETYFKYSTSIPSQCQEMRQELLIAA